MERKVFLTWNGRLKEGKGNITTESNVLVDIPFSYEMSRGITPEELIAAAYGSCFSMILVDELEKQGYLPRRISAEGGVFITKNSESWKISLIRFDITANVPHLKKSDFEKIIHFAQLHCPVFHLEKTELAINSLLESDVA